MAQRITKKTGVILAAITIIAIGLIIAAKPKTPSDTTTTDQQSAPPSMSVTVTVVEKKPMRLWSSYSGRLKAVDYVEIRPQVSGRIEEIKFTDGDIVKKDDILFIIEPRPYEAALAEAKAALGAAKSQHTLAVKEQNRAEKLIKTEAVSQRILDERRSAAKIAQNTLNGAHALVERAQIDVDRAYVKAPIAGRISRAEITLGNLVQTGPNAPILASIVSQDGIYADFEIDEQTYLQQIRRQASPQNENTNIPVQLILSDGTTRTGKIKSFDNRINTSSGTIRARAYFENNENTLLSGMYVTVKLGNPEEENVILLPEKSIGTDQNRKFVYTVENNQATYRQITLGPSINDQRVITNGLKPGEQVITEGIIRIMPGMSVTPQTTETKVEKDPETTGAKQP